MANIKLLLVDDHGPLRKALREGLQATGVVHVVGEAATGHEAVARALELDMDVILMDVPLLRDAVNGRSLVDPEIEDRVQEVRDLDEQSPRALLEPNELRVAELVAQGMTNEQIAARLNLYDKRAVSRTNGRIYAAWGLSETAVDDKVARARATLIFTLNRMIIWDENGVALVQDRRGEWVPLYLEAQTDDEATSTLTAEPGSVPGYSTRENGLHNRFMRRNRRKED